MDVGASVGRPQLNHGLVVAAQVVHHGTWMLSWWQYRHRDWRQCAVSGRLRRGRRLANSAQPWLDVTPEELCQMQPTRHIVSFACHISEGGCDDQNRVSKRGFTYTHE